MNASNSVISYFIYKNVEKRGFLKYGFFKRMIAYVLDYHNDYYIRKIFLDLLDKGFFIKQKNSKISYKYKFNPNPTKQKTKKVIIDPARFIINWD